MSASETQATIADLQATIERLTAAVEKASAATESRLSSIDARLASLEASGKGGLDRVVSQGAVASAEAALESVHGKDVMHARIAELFTRLGDPETLESLARVATLAPSLEYALQAVAAGPELLEDGLDLVRDGTRGGPSADLRLRAAIDALGALTTPRTITSLASVAVNGATLESTIGGAAGSIAALEEVHGKGVMREKIAELVLALGDPETIESLTRVISLAPKLEYAAYAAAAGPELLEEAMAFVKDLADRNLGAGPTMDRRLDALKDAGIALTDPRTVTPLVAMAAGAAKLAPLVTAGADAVDQILHVEGREATQQRVTDVVLALADGETLESLARVVTLIPMIEYAVQALAAGPELLEEGLEMVRDWSRTKLGDAGAIDQRLGLALDAVAAFTQPAILGALTKSLPPLLATPGLLDALPRLVRHVPRLAATLDRAIGSLDRAIESEKLDDAGIDARLDEGIALVVSLTEPKKLAALRKASMLLTMLDDALRDVSEDDAERSLAELIEVVSTFARPDVLEGMHRMLAALPGLVETLDALPVQPHTLELLRNANQSLEEARPSESSIGVFGLWRVLHETDVQATLTLGIDVARKLGRRLGKPRRKPAQLRS